MQINNEGLEIVKKCEGLRLKEYICPSGLLTIGYGHVLLKNESYQDGISLAKAEELLKKDLNKFESGVKALVKIPLNENQFSAIVSLAFNIGLNALAKSTLLRLLNENKITEASKEFSKWVYGANKKKLAGLIVRRNLETALFLKKVK